MSALLLAGCATRGAGWPPSRGLSVLGSDTATAGCLRNPACYGSAPGEEAVLPWLVRSAEVARTAATVMRLLETAEVSRVEQLLVQCAREAHFQVNARDPELQGASPTEAQCKQVVRQENGKDITRAMDFGEKKHALALECVRRELGKLFPHHFSVEPRYVMDASSGRWGWIDPVRVAEWLKQGLSNMLKGSLVPDLVLHAAGNPNDVQLVYDFKFPCPATREPRWSRYPPDHPHHPRDQGEMYQRALGGQQQPARVSPAFGISR